MGIEDTIQFIAKHGDWVVVKKTRPQENTPLENALFLSGLLSTIYNRLEKYLQDAFDLIELDKAVEDIIEGKRASSSSLGEIIASINGPKINKIINNIVEGLHDLQKKEREAVKSLLKAYALRKALLELKLKIDYSVAAEELKKGLGKFKKNK